MTISNISKRQIVEEYVLSRTFDVVTFDKDGKRLGTQMGLDLHKAFAEVLFINKYGSAKVMVLQFPESMSVTEKFAAHRTVETAKPFLAELNLGR